MAPSRLAGTGSNNLLLASGLALLSYVPFQYVAKGSLIVCAILFVLDPIPPLSRLLALISLLVVYFLSKLHKQAVLAAEQNEEITIVAGGVEEEENNNDNNNNNNKNNNKNNNNNNTADETNQSSKPKGD
ncbi:unnamed protein product [Cylindrotheca closterium]|uniref:Uncharacterized protein n=1 Tax=Cylindrotheca closterium TaxID=2856 RepID=A0AAD2G5W1_9STRA|nr:unnamed protein product [Cylindrotheca closterium]